MAYEKMTSGNGSMRVAFEKETTTFIPYDEPPSPVKTISSESINNKNVFLDEIALAKRQMIPRQATLRNRNMEPTGEKEKFALEPISAEELRRKGIVLEDGKVVYHIPPTVSSVSPCRSRCSASLHARSSSADSIVSLLSTLSSKVVSLDEIVSMETHNVGLPNEFAQLKFDQFKNGERYELIVDNNNVCGVEISSKYSLAFSRRK